MSRGRAGGFRFAGDGNADVVKRTMPGHRLEVFSLDGTALGPAHVPTPVAVGDVVALVCGPPLKIVSIFREDDDAVGISVRPLYVTGNLP